MPATISHAKSNTIADFSGVITVHDSTLGSVTMQASDLLRPSDWNSSHVASIAVANTEMYGADTYWEPYQGLMAANYSTMSGHSLSSMYVDPFTLPLSLTKGVLHFAIQEGTTGFLNGNVYSAAATGNATRYQTNQTQFALYSAGTGANITRLESIWSVEVSYMATWARSVGATTTGQVTVSNALTLNFPSQFDASGGMTYGSTTQSGTVSGGASTLASTIADPSISGIVTNYFAGSKILPVGFNTTLPAGQYALAINITSSTSSSGVTSYTAGSMFSTQSMMGIVDLNARAYRRMGKSVSDSSSCIPAMHGIYATTTTSPPAIIGGTSDMRNIGSPRHAWFYWMRTSY